MVRSSSGPGNVYNLYVASPLCLIHSTSEHERLSEEGQSIRAIRLHFLMIFSMSATAVGICYMLHAQTPGCVIYIYIYILNLLKNNSSGC